ncbi:LysR family transcriptional regulator [Cupriavidus nantongensis]|uniref:LysR family transcriptional regulator n=1 Tax=Cupriavidus nantongensis TaxID=1796606 RepID=A0A142JK96_9BURK|nr:LysR family transcriptional regulator [Cupriavidus nantongensis]AMR78508.1 LysR family transcriptional regulator [Cupriavidus nantongensis]
MLYDNNGEPDSQSDGRLPSLVALRCFEAAARLENFSRAAEELHLTHGAVSRAVRALEEDLGVRLFERRSRRVFLTPSGRKLGRAVSEGLEVIRQAIRELRVGARQSRHWVLSCEPTLLMRWLIPRWPGFQAAHPRIDVHLVAGGGPFSFHNGIDLAIRRNDFDWPDSYHAVPLFPERVGPVCRPDQVSRWFTALGSKASLKREAPRLQTRTRPGAWRQWASLSGHTLPPGKETVFEHFYFSLQAAVAGLGVAMGPWQLVRDDIERGVLCAPMGFIEDGTQYCLLSATPIGEGSDRDALLAWLRGMA